MKMTKIFFNRTVFLTGLLIITVTGFLTVSFKKRLVMEDVSAVDDDLKSDKLDSVARSAKEEDNRFTKPRPKDIKEEKNDFTKPRPNDIKEEKNHFTKTWPNDIKEEKNDFTKPRSKDVKEEKNLFTKPWPNDIECSSFVNGFGKALPMVFLLSYPRSGNTWTRYLLESATGIYTSSVYHDPTLSKDFLGEKEPVNSGRSVVVKAHPGSYFGSYASKEEYKDVPSIVLIRRPGDSILSFWHWKYGVKHGKRRESMKYIAPERTYNTSEFRQFVDQQTKSFNKSFEKILTTVKIMHIMFYENLVRDPISEIRELLKLLGIPAQEERINCLRNHIEGVAKRNYEKKEPYTRLQKKVLNEVQANLVDLLIKKGIRPPEEYSHKY